LKNFKRLAKIYHIIYIYIYIYILAEEFELFSTDSNNWKYNIMINNPDHDPYNNDKKLDPFGYYLYKYNTIIMIKEILKYTKQ